VSIKLLLDENISPTVAHVLTVEDGFDVCHVRDRGLLEATDREVFARAFAQDRVLVTKNVADFVKLARAAELHAGIFLLEDGALRRTEQLVAVRCAVAAVEYEAIDMANQVARIAWTAP
jgi:predicted nuclease of predicted toxin-antitoxin system